MPSSHPGSRPPRARPAPEQAGFTLVELLVALVISGILATVIFESLLGQSRFARLQGARQEVQQNSRAALDLIGAELRGVAPRGLITAEPQSISFRSPRIWGVACGYLAGSLVVLFPSYAGDEGIPAGLRLAVESPAAGGWAFTSATGAPGSAALVTCNGQAGLGGVAPSPAATAERVRVYGGSSFPSDVAPGSRVYLYQSVSYAVGAGTGSSAGEQWILRDGTAFAGPVPANGLQLAYEYSGAGSGPDNVRSIGITVLANSRARFGQNRTPQDNTASTRIFLRNRVD
ncbi:hypothetical protein BH23GEM3_BH23GEM3_07700 [soil metagenome]